MPPKKSNETAAPAEGNKPAANQDKSKKANKPKGKWAGKNQQNQKPKNQTAVAAPAAAPKAPQQANARSGTSWEALACVALCKAAPQPETRLSIGEFYAGKDVEWTRIAGAGEATKMALEETMANCHPLGPVLPVKWGFEIKSFPIVLTTKAVKSIEVDADTDPADELAAENAEAKARFEAEQPPKTGSPSAATATAKAKPAFTPELQQYYVEAADVVVANYFVSANHRILGYTIPPGSREIKFLYCINGGGNVLNSAEVPLDEVIGYKPLHHGLVAVACRYNPGQQILKVYEKGTRMTVNHGIGYHPLDTLQRCIIKGHFEVLLDAASLFWANDCRGLKVYSAPDARSRAIVEEGQKSVSPAARRALLVWTAVYMFREGVITPGKPRKPEQARLMDLDDIM